LKQQFLSDLRMSSRHPPCYLIEVTDPSTSLSAEWLATLPGDITPPTSPTAIPPAPTTITRTLTTRAGTKPPSSFADDVFQNPSNFYGVQLCLEADEEEEDLLYEIDSFVSNRNGTFVKLLGEWDGAGWEVDKEGLRSLVRNSCFV
jgi:hypothetical protein